MKRLLILDDEPSITFSLSRCLRSEKVDVISCNSSEAAKAEIHKKTFDAVIADMRISPVNSHEAIEFIQYVRSRSNDLPLIMMSGTEDLKTEAFEGGANYFFQKPLDVDELISLLNNLGLEVGKKELV